uniref:Uncharacterized protein n=1 Tax=Oryza meridionalis TaxID=40149 RepID=A0A0E0F869_9ORYZ
MKQVRDLAYVADDCVKLYRRDLAPPEPGFWPWLCHIPTYVSTMPTRHRLAKKIHKLKERVREVGERRQRYDVKLPDNQQGGDNRDDDDDESLVADGDDERRKLLLEDGLRALDVDGGQGQQQQIIEVENAIIGMLPKDFVSKDDIHKIVTRCLKESDLGAASMKLLLRALRAHPHGWTKKELDNLSRKADVPNELMILCYSKLSTHQKSCMPSVPDHLPRGGKHQQDMLWSGDGSPKA